MEAIEQVRNLVKGPSSFQRFHISSFWLSE